MYNKIYYLLVYNEREVVIMTPLSVKRNKTLVCTLYILLEQDSLFTTRNHQGGRDGRKGLAPTHDVKCGSSSSMQQGFFQSP